MNNNITVNHVYFARAGKPKRPPRTVTEMADEFGITRNQLTYRLSASKVTPPTSFKTGSTHKNTWYDPVALRAWWKLDNEGVQ